MLSREGGANGSCWAPSVLPISMAVGLLSWLFRREGGANGSRWGAAGKDAAFDGALSIVSIVLWCEQSMSGSGSAFLADAKRLSSDPGGGKGSCCPGCRGGAPPGGGWKCARAPLLGEGPTPCPDVEGFFFWAPLSFLRCLAHVLAISAAHWPSNSLATRSSVLRVHARSDDLPHTHEPAA